MQFLENPMSSWINMHLWLPVAVRGSGRVPEWLQIIWINVNRVIIRQDDYSVVFLWFVGWWDEMCVIVNSLSQQRIWVLFQFNPMSMCVT